VGSVPSGDTRMCDFATALRVGGYSRSLRRFLVLGYEFQRLIANLARSRFLEETCDHVLLLSEWGWHQFFLLNGSHPSDSFTHDDIIRVIVDRDADRACHVLARHIQSSRDLVRGTM